MGMITVYRKSDGSPLRTLEDWFDPETMTRESPGGGSEAPTDPAERLAAIRDAVGQLDPENPEHFTKGGDAKVEAIEAILGWNISAAERDEAKEPAGDE